MKFNKIIAIAACAVSLAGSVSAGTIGVFGDNAFGFDSISDLYNSGVMPNSHSASDLGTLDAPSVAGLDLLWMTQPNNAYTASQLGVLNNYLDGGGRIAFLGEHGSIAQTQNNNINTALVALGSTMSIDNVLLDSGFRDATVANGQILADPLTAGVNTYNYAAYAPMNVGGGVTLMYGSDLTTSMMSFENVRAGSIFMITDQNVFDNAMNIGDNDNAIMFDNLVTGDTQNPNVVPLPAAGWMLLTSLGGLAAIQRRRKSS